MTDIKLFRMSATEASELLPTKIALEKHVQTMFEAHMEALLGIRFLAGEYVTGKKYQGRIDSLGLDENSSPVIVEYKLHQNQNVINQGLFYLDWLLDHRAEFEQVARDKLRSGEEVDRSSPRVLCVAEDFTRYDIYAVEQIGRSIELIRYKLYADLLLLELVNRPGTAGKPPKPVPSQPIAELLDERISALGDDVQRKQLKHYVAYRRLRNFASVESFKSHVLVFLRLRPETIQLEDGFARDVTAIGHHASGDVELRLVTTDDVQRAMPLIQLSYEAA